MKTNTVVIFFILLLIFLGFFHPITAFTQDLGRHIKTGEIILQTHEIPKTNLYSYTYPNFPFINHHWLSEVIFYTITITTGIGGLQIITTTIVLLAFFLLLRAVWKTAHPIALGIAGLLYVRLLFERTDLRPEMFSFLFLALFVTILYQYRQGFTRWIFILPLLELFWVNTHIYFFVGIVVVGLFLIDHLVTQRKHKKYQYTSTLVFVFFFSCLVTVINPNGLEGALYPLRVFQNYGYTIEENQHMFFLWEIGLRHVAYTTLGITSLLMMISLFVDRKKTALVDWLLFIVFLLASISAVRNIPLFVFATFIPFVIHFSALTKEVLKKLSKKYEFVVPFLYVGLLFCFLWQSATIVSQKGFGIGVLSGAEKGVDFFIKQNLSGPIFNNFDIGSYLDYRLYPKEKVFVDGRPEAYPATFFQQTYIPLQQNPVLFEKTAEKYHFNTIFFSHTDQTPWAEKFLQTTITNDIWVPVYLDDTVIIFVKNTSKNRNVINQFAIKKDIFSPSVTNKTPLSSLLQLTRFFNLVGWQNQEITMYQKLLDRDPNYCLALHNLAIIYAQQNSPSSQIYAARFSQNCQ